MFLKHTRSLDDSGMIVNCVLVVMTQMTLTCVLIISKYQITVVSMLQVVQIRYTAQFVIDFATPTLGCLIDLSCVHMLNIYGTYSKVSSIL